VGDRRELGVRDALYFDRWYADMKAPSVKDVILRRNLAVPEDLGSVGVLHWNGVLELVASLHLRRGGLLVDVACGRGGYGVEVAQRSGARLVGVDFSAVALAHARTIAERRLPPRQAEFRIGTLTATELPALGPDWLAAEHRAWKEALDTPHDGDDVALSSFQAEAERSLRTVDAMQRVVAFASAP